MTVSKKLLVATIALGFALACNRRSAPCTQTTNNQTAPPPTASAPNIAPAATEPETSGPSYKPKAGYVPDEQTAVAIAVAVFIPIYGKEQIDSEKPFHATLRNGVWFVEGSLDKPRIGGTAMAQIAQNDGRILHVIHYK